MLAKRNKNTTSGNAPAPKEPCRCPAAELAITLEQIVNECCRLAGTSKLTPKCVQMFVNLINELQGFSDLMKDTCGKNNHPELHKMFHGYACTLEGFLDPNAEKSTLLSHEDKQDNNRTSVLKAPRLLSVNIQRYESSNRQITQFNQTSSRRLEIKVCEFRRDLREFSTIPAERLTQYLDCVVAVFRSSRDKTKFPPKCACPKIFYPKRGGYPRKVEVPILSENDMLEMLKNSGLLTDEQLRLLEEFGLSEELMLLLSGQELTDEQLERLLAQGILTQEQIDELRKSKGLGLGKKVLSSKEMLDQLKKGGLLTEEQLKLLADGGLSDELMALLNGETLTDEQIAKLLAEGILTKEQIDQLLSANGNSNDILNRARKTLLTISEHSDEDDDESKSGKPPKGSCREMQELRQIKRDIERKKKEAKAAKLAAKAAKAEAKLAKAEAKAAAKAAKAEAKAAKDRASGKISKPPKPEKESKSEKTLISKAKSKTGATKETKSKSEASKSSKGSKKKDKEVPCSFSYKLSDTNFIEMGWTDLPTQNIMYEHVVYRARPFRRRRHVFGAHCPVTYRGGAALAVDRPNHTKCLLYPNGRVAVVYHKDTHGVGRYTLYGPGPAGTTILGIFDTLGYGVVYDSETNIRLSYSQMGGIYKTSPSGMSVCWDWFKGETPEPLSVYQDTNLEKMFRLPKAPKKEKKGKSSKGSKGSAKSSKSKKSKVSSKKSKGSSASGKSDPSVVSSTSKSTHSKGKDHEWTVEFLPTLKSEPKVIDKAAISIIEKHRIVEPIVSELSRKAKPPKPIIPMKPITLKISEEFSLRVIDQHHINLHFCCMNTRVCIDLGVEVDTSEELHKRLISREEAKPGAITLTEDNPVQTKSILQICDVLKANRVAYKKEASRLKRVNGPVQPLFKANMNQVHC